MTVALPSLTFEEDQHVVLRAMSWQDFEALLAIRGERAGVRMYYLDGEIELVSSTKLHEERKTTLARLLEVWALESDLSLNGFGSSQPGTRTRSASARVPRSRLALPPERARPSSATRERRAPWGTLTEGERALLDERLREYRADPESGQTWAEARAEILRQR